MAYLRVALGLALALAVILYLTKPAEPVAGSNIINYDGETIKLNGRSTTEANLRNMEFPEGSEIMIYLGDAEHADFGAQAGLLYHWDEEGIQHFFNIDGVPLQVDTISWRRATNEEIQQETDAENTRRQAMADLRRNRVDQEEQATPSTTVNDAPPESEDESGFTPFQPTDTNRYYWNGEMLGTAAQTEQKLQQVRLIQPGAILVMPPNSDYPPGNVQNVEALGFTPVVTEFLERTSDAGIHVHLHRGQGFTPPKPQLNSLGMLGGFFYAYLGPLVLMVAAVFLVSWIMEGGRAQREY